MQLATRTPLPPASRLCTCTSTPGPSASGRRTTAAFQRPGTLSGKPRRQPRQSQMQQGQQGRLAASLAACNSRILMAQRVRQLWLRKQHQGRLLYLPRPAAATAAAAATPGIGRAQGLTAGTHGLMLQHPTAHQHQAHRWHMHPAAAAFGPQEGHPTSPARLQRPARAQLPLCRPLSPAASALCSGQGAEASRSRCSRTSPISGQRQCSWSRCHQRMLPQNGGSSLQSCC